MRALAPLALLLPFALVARADEPVPVDWDRDLAATCEEAAEEFASIASECEEDGREGPRLRLLLRGLRYAPFDPDLRTGLGQAVLADGSWGWTPEAEQAFVHAVSTASLSWPIEQEERVRATETRFAARMLALAERADAFVEHGHPSDVWETRGVEAGLWAVDLAPTDAELRTRSSTGDDVRLLDAIRKRRSERRSTVDRRLRRATEDSADAAVSILDLAGLDANARSLAGLTVEATRGREAAERWLRAGVRARDALLADGIVRDDELPENAVRHLVVVESKADFAAACAVAGWDADSIRDAVDSLAAVYLRDDVVLIRARDPETAEAWCVRYLVRSALPGICVLDDAEAGRSDWEPWLRTALVEEVVRELATPCAVRLADDPVAARTPTPIGEDIVLRTRLLATAGLLVPFEELSVRRLDELGPRDRLQASALLRFLRDMYPEQVAPLLRTAARVGYAKAVEQVMERDPAWVDGSFRRWLRLTRALDRS